MNERLPEKLELREVFAPSDHAAWKKVAEADLKGIPFEKKLVTKTYEGIDLQPIYTREHLEKLPALDQFPGLLRQLRGSTASGNSSGAWLIAQGLSHPLAENYNKLLIDALNKGQNAIVLPLDLTTRSGLDADYGEIGQTGKDGVSISGIGSLSRAWKGVDPKACPFFVNTGATPLAFMSLFSAWLKKEGSDISEVSGAVYADPVAMLFETGRIPVTIDEAYTHIAGSINYIHGKGSGIRAAGIDASVYAGSGASAVQELGIAIASAAEMIHRLKKEGIAPEVAASALFFRFGISTNLFMEIAKFRASRLLFTELLSQLGIDPTIPQFMAAKTSDYYHSTVDPYVNMLRVTTQAFSAVNGGVNVLETVPFDSLLTQSDEFANRIARNTQLILGEESHLDHVTDPSGGSYYIETLSSELAQQAWQYFREIETAGGIIEALLSGKIVNDIKTVAGKRIKDVASRRSVMVGVNQYANLKEEVRTVTKPDPKEIYDRRAEWLQKFRVSGSSGYHDSILVDLEKAKNESDITKQIDIAAELALKGATLGEIFSHIKNSSEVTVSQTLVIERPAEQFERLRLRSASHKAKTGSFPSIYLFNIGPVKQHKARADFSRGFFEAGGCEVINGKAVDNINDGIAAAKESGAKVFVLCSTDDTYPQLVPEFTNGIRSALPGSLCVLAGYPKDQVDDHKRSGIDDFIFLGADVVQIISSIFEKTGVAK